ncbi:hypothetical protein [Streptomyces sp. CG 926]|uniref:hypothetical protein n=1 Tax=Streptomyces sp. CG 926 TaxID=1882405 RepID=UPI0011B360F7|nr:hypothetical protein [Streptomyces sp. CG 926]
MFVLVLSVGRRFEPPTGGASRIQGGGWIELPCQDARDTVDVLRSLADPAVPAEQRARMARAIAAIRGRPVVEALVQTPADAEPEVAEVGPETLCAIWRREGVVGEELLLKLDPQAQDRVRSRAASDLVLGPGALDRSGRIAVRRGVIGQALSPHSSTQLFRHLKMFQPFVTISAVWSSSDERAV